MSHRVRHIEEVMGTVFTVDGVFPDPERAQLLVKGACALLHDVDRQLSTWDETSPMSRYRRGEISEDALPPSVLQVLDDCRAAKRVSGGWFDPWAAPGGIDPTGYVKGWAGQRLLRALGEAGASAALVNAAGDVTAFGEPSPDRCWRIGVTDPLSPHQILGVVTLRNSALAVSGTYERGHHIYGRDGTPTRSRVVSSAVTGPDLGMADALATGLVAGGASALGHVAELPGHEGLLVFDDGRQLRTDGFVLEV